MTFQEALQKLDIVDYKERIFNSNSHGELMHLGDYILLAKWLEDWDMLPAFRPGFVKLVEWAEKNWDRPESIFQHIPRCMGFTQHVL